MLRFAGAVADRKNLDEFENLVVLRPVHDSNGVCRFCIGLSLEVVGRYAPRIARSTGRFKNAMIELSSLRSMVRSWVPRPSGRIHPRNAVLPKEQQNSKPSAVSTMLYQALENHFLLHQLSAPCKRALVAAMQKLRVFAGQQLIKHGDPPDEIYILTDGVCSVRDANFGHVDMIHPGSVVGELALIYGTRRTATILTERDCVFYVLPKAQYTSILTRLDASATDLVPPATAFVESPEWVMSIERKLMALIEATYESHTDGAGSEKMHSQTPSVIPAAFAGNHGDMQGVLSALAMRQQLSVLYWLNNPASSLLLLLQNSTTRTFLTAFMHKYGHSKAAMQLDLAIQLDEPNPDLGTIYNGLCNEALDVNTHSATEVNERLRALVSLCPPVPLKFGENLAAMLI